MAHVEIQADDVERATAFYAAVLGCEYRVAGSAYWGIVTGPEDQPGINGGLFRRRCRRRDRSKG